MNEEVTIQMCVECAEIPCSIIRDKEALDLCFAKADKIVNSTNSQKRWSCCRNYYAFIFGPGEARVRIQLPHYSEMVVKDRYPEDDVSKYISIYTLNTIKQECLTLHLLLESNIINLINYMFILIYKSRDKQFSNNTSFLFNR